MSSSAEAEDLCFKNQDESTGGPASGTMTVFVTFPSAGAFYL